MYVLVNSSLFSLFLFSFFSLFQPSAHALHTLEMSAEGDGEINDIDGGQPAQQVADSAPNDVDEEGLTAKERDQHNLTSAAFDALEKDFR